MIDYTQPDFYRFNEDSLDLVREVLTVTPKARRVLDMGAGSGVIGLELARVFQPAQVDFLELQTEWKPFLEKNISDFLPVTTNSSVFWTSFSSWKPDEKYDLIVCNPPYYPPGKGILSPDKVRARCRAFLEDDWSILISKSIEALCPSGRAWFVTTKENQSHVLGVVRDYSYKISEIKDLVIFSVGLDENGDHERS